MRHVITTAFSSGSLYWVLIKMNTPDFELLLLWKHDKINYLQVTLYTFADGDLH